LQRPTVRKGSRGEHVETLQKLLGVAIDGKFGPKTEAAVKAAQRKAKLTADGIVGPYTWAALSV
jgi:peptidoglycan hydrolase-like protein with peptidoglycan-binding domain